MNVSPSAPNAAEASVLGAVLLNNDAFFRVQLQPDDFAYPHNRVVWAGMQALAKRGAAIDPVLLEAELGGDRMRAIGGFVYISELVGTVPMSDNIEFYAEEVARAALTRRVRVACSQLMHSSAEGEDLLNQALETITRLGVKHGDDAIPMSELASATLTKLVEDMARRAEGDTAAGGFSTGLASLDALLGGIQPGVVTILGGRPSMGKSALARTVAGAASAAGIGVHVFSLEDVAGAYAKRELADRGRVDLHRVTTMQLASGDMARLDKAARELGKHRRWLIDDAAGLSASQIAVRVRRRIVENETRLVIVDYVQDMREPEARRADKRIQVALSIEGLHELARKEKLGMLVISQLSRRLEERDDKRPMLSDLREAGELEQVADSVLFCYRDEVYNIHAPRGRAEIIVAKNKHGQTGTVHLVWDAPTATYRDPVARNPWERDPGEDG